MAYADTASIGGIKRINFEGEDGVFLRNDQEILTLAKIVLKSVYKSKTDLANANATYFWSLYASEKNLHNKTIEENKILKQQNELKTKQLTQAANANAALASENKVLEEQLDTTTKQRNGSRATTVALIVALVTAVITK
jgi:hypothetical protein